MDTKALLKSKTRFWMNNLRWDDALFKEMVTKKVWQVATAVSVIYCGIMTYQNIELQKLIEKKSNDQRLILVPAIQRKMVIPSGEAFLTESYIKAVSNRIVELNEQWTWESLEGNYEELFDQYYSHGLEQLTRGNLMATGRIEEVKEKKMVSVFKIDHKRSKYGWCKKLKRSCSIIIGTRTLYASANIPFQKKNVGYFILGEGNWPTDNHPLAVKISRLVVNDRDEDPYQEMMNIYSRALEGEI